ncbi:MAG: hypothetical protein HYX27_18385 [Acidobacteria bacterium]|nr:hypothetical protein [Acidobacteriota bacterium]
MSRVALGALFAAIPALAQQASLTLVNSNAALCNKNNTEWSISKTNDPPGPVLSETEVTWTVKVTRGATSNNTLCVDGFVSVQNTGTAAATIGNIVVNLQKRVGNNWVSAAADVADATSGNAATSANIVAGASQESTNGINYVISGAKGTFSETAASGELKFTDATNNSVFSLVPQPVLPAGQTIDLLFSAEFNNSILALASGASVRAEVIVTFGNAGGRGGSGASSSNFDINGNGSVDTDERYIRSVPVRLTMTVPPLQKCNDTVTLTDVLSAIDATYVAGQNDIGVGITISAGGTSTYLVKAKVSGEGSVTNTATITGQGSSVVVNGPIDPITLKPIYSYEFICCVGVAASASSTVDVVGGSDPPFPPGKYCTVSQGGYQGGGFPGELFDNYFILTFDPAGLTIGLNDGLGSKHHALWNATVAGGTALKSVLAGGGPSGMLTGDTVNASSLSGGALAKQTAALSVTIGFSNAGWLQAGFGGLTLVDTGTSLDGKTVTQILSVANDALGAGLLPGDYSFSTLNALIANLNLSFDSNLSANKQCTASPWALLHLKP